MNSRNGLIYKRLPSVLSAWTGILLLCLSSLKLTARNPEFLSSLLAKADSLAQASNYERSNQLLDLASLFSEETEHRPGHEIILLKKAQNLLSQGLYQEAFQLWYACFEQLKKTSPDRIKQTPFLNSVPLFIETLLAQGLNAKAAALLEKIQNHLPSSPLLQLQNAILLRRLGQNATAEQAFSEVLQLDLSPGQRLRARKEAAFNHFRLGNIAACQTQLELGYKERNSPLIRKEIQADFLDFYGYIERRQGRDSQSLELRLEAAELYRNYNIYSKQANACFKNLAILFYSEANYEQAQKYFDQSYRVSRNLRQIPQIASALAGLGDVYLSMQDYDRALDHYQQAIRNLENPQSRLELIALANAYSGSAAVYLEKKNFPEAIRHYILAFTPLENLGSGMQGAIGIQHSNITNAYLKAGQARKAISSMKQARSVFASLGPEAEVDLIQSTVYLAYLYHLHEQADSSAIFRNKTLQMLQKSPNLSARQLAVVKETLGTLALDQAEPALALDYFHTALTPFVIGFADENPNENPTPKQIISVAEVHNLIALKADAFHKMAQQAPIAEQLALQQKALKAFQDAASLLPLIRGRQNRTQSKLTLSSQKISFFEKAVELAVDIYQKTGELAYLESAFSFSEQSRANVLLESVNEQKYRLRSGDVPEENQRLQKLKGQIGLYEKKATEARSAEAKDSLSAQVFRLRDEYDQLNSQLIRQQPSRISQIKSSTIAQIQELLPGDSSALVEYFWGDSALFIFTLTAGQAEVSKQPLLSQYQSDLDTFAHRLSHHSPNSNADPRLVKTAANLYRLLLDHLDTQRIRRLLIVPSGPLNLIPFDALLSSEPSYHPGLKYHELPWAIHQFTISNHWSATFFTLGETEKPNSPPQDILGVSPDFSQYTSLPEAREGIKDVTLSYKKARGLLGSEATKESFLQTAKEYSILDLATHGYIYPDNPGLSGLIFSNPENSHQDDTLFMFELYNQSWQADLAILEACETGGGQLQRGEGVMSLARGFTLAGCRAVIMSYWMLDDKNSSKILSSFYEELPKGKAQAQALRQAKRNLISNARGGKAWQSHPYFWAAFTHIGKNSTLDLKPKAKGSWWMWILLSSGILAGLTVLVLLYRK